MYRTRLHLSGIKVPKLGSPQDKIFRQYLIKESERASAKVNLLGLLVANSIPFNDAAASQEWESKVKRIWNNYLALEYGLELPPDKEKELEMQEFYLKKVKALKPKLSRDTDGRLLVSGLDDLMQ